MLHCIVLYCSLVGDRPTSCPQFDGVGMNLCSLVVVVSHASSLGGIFHEFV